MKHCISLSCKGSNLPVWLQHKSSDNKGFTASSETCTFGIRCFFSENHIRNMVFCWKISANKHWSKKKIGRNKMKSKES